MLPLSFVGAPLEMTKRRWRKLMHTLYENHFDPRKDEELKQSKTDIEDKLPKILKLVKERRSSRRNRNVEANLRKESELVELIEDFHKQYQFVYGQYDNIRGYLSQTVNGAKEDEGYFTATSSSDSDTESENDVNTKEKVSSVSSEHMKAMIKAQENEKIMQDLKERLDEKSRVISSLVGIQKRCQKEVSGLLKDLESEFSLLNRKLDGMRSEKMVSKQREENGLLQNRTSKLEEIAKEMDDEISQLVKNGVEGVTEEEWLVSDVSKVKGLVVQVNDLKVTVDCLISNAQKTDSEQHKTSQGGKNGYAVHENLLEQVNNMKHDLGLMRKKNAEFDSNLKKKAQENSVLLSQIDDLKKEVTSKTEELQKFQKEREDSVARMKKLELEASNLTSQRSEGEKVIARKEQERLKSAKEIEGLREKMAKMEKLLKTEINRLEKELELKTELETQIIKKDNDISKLTEEKKLIQDRISELGKKLRDKDMKKKFDEQIDSHDKEIRELGEKKESLEEKVFELEMMLTEREDEIAELQRSSQVGENEVSYLQGELSVERKKFSERLNELETRNNELSFKVSDQEFMIKQQEDTIKKLRGDCKLVKGRFLQAAERKMDEVAAEFRKNFEDQLRMLSRRIKVAEQLHVETKESWKRTQERCELKHPGLEKKLAQMIVPSFVNVELRTTFSQGVDEVMKGMEDLVRNFESKEDNFLERLSKVSNEVQVTKNWVRWTMDGIKPWKNEPPLGSPFAPTMDDKDKMMKEKVRRLEAKVNKEKGDKLRLMRGMYEMQKKVAELDNEVVAKDEELLRLGEEKVEAIRQLCTWIDYQQNRFDQLKEVVLVKKTKGKGRS